MPRGYRSNTFGIKVPTSIIQLYSEVRRNLLLIKCECSNVIWVVSETPAQYMSVGGGKIDGGVEITLSSIRESLWILEFGADEMPAQRYN